MEKGARHWLGRGGSPIPPRPESRIPGLCLLSAQLHPPQSSPVPTADVDGLHLALQPHKQDRSLNKPLVKAQTCPGRTPKAGGASPPQPFLARLQRILVQGHQQGSPQTWAIGCHLSQERAEHIQGPAFTGEAQRQTEVGDMQDRTKKNGHMQRPQQGGRGPRTKHGQGVRRRGTMWARLTEAPGSW